MIAAYWFWKQILGNVRVQQVIVSFQKVLRSMDNNRRSCNHGPGNLVSYAILYSTAFNVTCAAVSQQICGTTVCDFHTSLAEFLTLY
jgi:hypothetical protein